MELDGSVVWGRIGRKIKLGFMKTSQNWKVMDWGNSISFNMGCSFSFFSSAGFLGSVLILTVVQIGILRLHGLLSLAFRD